jgi:biopolymer transport protein ExbB/biopolymer transport protein TolQ
MDMSPQALWAAMTWGAKSVVILMLFMSIFSIWVMVERYITFQKAKNQSLKLLGALSNVLTRGDYAQAIDIAKKYKDSHLAKVISAGLLEFEAARRWKRRVRAWIAPP